MQIDINIKNNTMKIIVFGTGCPGCKKFLQTTKKVVKDLQLKANLEYIDDIPVMIEFGVMTSPSLVVNGEVVLSGGDKSEADIKEVLLDYKK